MAGLIELIKGPSENIKEDPSAFEGDAISKAEVEMKKMTLAELADLKQHVNGHKQVIDAEVAALKTPDATKEDLAKLANKLEIRNQLSKLETALINSEHGEYGKPAKQAGETANWAKENISAGTKVAGDWVGSGLNKMKVTQEWLAEQSKNLTGVNVLPYAAGASILGALWYMFGGAANRPVKQGEKATTLGYMWSLTKRTLLLAGGGLALAAAFNLMPKSVLDNMRPPAAPAGA